MEEIYARMPEGVIGVEDWNRYDGIAYYYDQANNQRYSKKGYPIANDEMCLYGDVCKVECVRDWEGQFEYHWKILSRRPDTDGNIITEMS